MEESEVARVKRQIEQDYQAAHQGCHGLALTAQHQFITARMENMGRLHERLKGLVGDDEANRFIVQTMEGRDDGKK